MRYPVQVHDKWGFIDETGAFRIAPSFQRVGFFSEGLASFQSDIGVGFLNQSGHEVIPPRFDVSPARLPEFRSGLAVVAKGGLFGGIGTEGGWKITPRWSACWDFVGDLAIAESEQGYFVISKSGGEISRLDVIEVPFVYDWPKSWSCFGCFFRIGEELKIGFVNSTGQIVFPPKYRCMTEFFEGVAGFCDNDEELHCLYGLTRITGEVFTQPSFYEMSNFEEGLARAGRTPKEFGFINSRGEWVIEPKYRQAQPFSNGLACVTLHDKPRRGKKGFINTKGEMVIEPRFDREATFNNGFAQVEYEGKQAVIDKAGQLIWETEIESER
jgi:hypothetical protein